MRFLKNLGLFFVVYLPAVALVGMLVGMIPAVRAQKSPDWDLGWNPILWLVVTAPWQAPAIVMVPVLHLVGSRAAARSAPRQARWVAMIASPLLMLLAYLAMWRMENMNIETVVVIVLAAVAYGAVLRIGGSDRENS